MKRILLGLITLLILAGCGRRHSPEQALLSDAAPGDGSAITDPILDTLRAFRTYYVIQSVTPMSENFAAYFEEDGELFGCRMAARTTDEMRTAPIQLDCWTGLFGVKPKNPVAVPSGRSSFVEAAKARLLKDHPNASAFLFTYLGAFRKVAVEEITPLSLPRPVFERYTATTNFDLYIDSRGRISDIQAPITGLGRGYGAWCSVNEVSACKGLPQFVPYVLPQSMEGSSLVGPRIKQKTKPVTTAYQNEWIKFTSAVGLTIKAIDESRYKNPITDILRAQTTSKLPPNLNLHMGLGLTLTKVTAGMDDQRAEAIVPIPVAAFFDEDFTFTKSDQFTGVRIDFLISGKRQKLFIKATNSSGKSITEEYALKVKAENQIIDGGLKALASASVEPKQGESSIELTVPVDARSKTITVKVDALLFPAAVFPQK